MDNKQRVREFITTNFYVPDGFELADGSSLIESGVVDSTGILEVIGFIEDNFSVKVEDDEMVPENLDSIENITSFVKRKST